MRRTASIAINAALVEIQQEPSETRRMVGLSLAPHALGKKEADAGRLHEHG